MVSIVAPVAWLCTAVLYFAFWARGLTLAQGIVVGVVAILSLFATLAVVWVSFGFRLYRRWVDG